MLEEFQAEPLTDCLGLDADSSGILYVPSGWSSLPAGTAGTPAVIGSPDSPVILVLHQPAGTTLALNSNLIFYGMLFVHSDTNTATVTGNGSVKLFGAMVVEGEVDIEGNITIVYDDTSATGDTNKLPSSAKFGRVAGSWLDASTAF